MLEGHSTDLLERLKLKELGHFADLLPLTCQESRTSTRTKLRIRLVNCRVVLETCQWVQSCVTTPFLKSTGGQKMK